ncbi:putative HTH-type transcriptional regulator [bacterium HR30]|nr:putative HTH-type transcriptional regulator [bacterium HR30]
MATHRRQRRTQAQRRAEARERLLQATIECLYELGYRGASTTEIARRAGLSHGGRLHHFPTKTMLVATAVEHLIHRRRDELVRAIQTLPSEADPIEAAIDVIWQLFQGPEFFAWLELAVAARTDPALRKVVRDLSQRFADTIEDTFLQLFPPRENGESLYAAIPTFVVAFFQGLALDNELLGYGVRTENALRLMKEIARSMASRFLFGFQEGRSGEPRRFEAALVNQPGERGPDGMLVTAEQPTRQEPQDRSGSTQAG